MANFATSYRKALLGVGALLMIVGLVGFEVARQQCNLIIVFTHPGPDAWDDYQKELVEVDILGIDPSSDARVLFDGFANRLSLIEASDGQGRRWHIRSIAKTGGGSRDELIFALLALFERNGIYSEHVDVYSNPEAAKAEDRTKVTRTLAWVPDLDRIFDPTLPAAGQHKDSGWKLLRGRSRIHYRFPSGYTIYMCPNSQSLGLW